VACVLSGIGSLYVASEALKPLFPQKSKKTGPAEVHPQDRPGQPGLTPDECDLSHRRGNGDITKGRRDPDISAKGRPPIAANSHDGLPELRRDSP
jgi:hypothetical protein